MLGLEKELFQSYARGDAAPAARILAADYIGFSGDGHRDSTTVRVYGDAAVAQSSGMFRAHSGRQSVTDGFRNTDVFVWRDGRWQIVATHLSKVPAPR